MQPAIRTTLYAAISALTLCATISTGEAADRFMRSTETGQPRELINRPDCCVLDSYDAPRRCDIADR